MTYRTSLKQGFTLIELLIVVAIIAILAAIAVPNFIEAQTRAKVSRVRADMSSITTAVEAYAVDYNAYPWYFNEEDPDFLNGSTWPTYDRSAPGSLAGFRYERRLPITLTTPVSYMATLLTDPFPNLYTNDPVEKLPHPYHYSNDQDDSANPGADPGAQGLDQYPVRGLYTWIINGVSKPAGAPYASDAVIWMMLSHGPDDIHNNPDDGLVPCSYDPSNGTTSMGDLYRFGPGIGQK